MFSLTITKSIPGFSEGTLGRLFDGPDVGVEVEHLPELHDHVRRGLAHRCLEARVGLPYRLQRRLRERDCPVFFLQLSPAGTSLNSNLRPKLVLQSARGRASEA